MKVLLVNQVFYPDVVATAQYLTDLAHELDQSGHEVTVLASRCGYEAPHPCYAAQEDFRGIRIVRVWPFTLGKKYKIGRFFDAFFLNAAFFARLLAMPRFDVVIALTSPPLVSAAACFVVRRRKSRFVYWVMDMNPDEAIAMGWIKKGSVLARVLEAVSRWTLQRSDKIIVLDRFMKERVTDCLTPSPCPLPAGEGEMDKKIHVIPPWSHDEDLELIPHAENPFRKQYGLENKFVVMYSGNHSVCHPLDTLLEAARLLKDDPGVMFVFIGGGARTEDVRLFKEKHGLENIFQMSYVPRSEIRYSLSAADLHAVVMGEKMAGIVHPCKIYGVLALGKPFAYIGPAQSHITDFIQQGAKGYTVRHGAAEKLIEAIQISRNMSQNESEIIRKAQRGLAARFSVKALIPQFLAEVSGKD